MKLISKEIGQRLCKSKISKSGVVFFAIYAVYHKSAMLFEFCNRNMSKQHEYICSCAFQHSWNV